MARNFKKKSAHNIYWGIDKETGIRRHISEVPSGACCGCICAACGKPLVARKGDVRSHHFAHENNDKCFYANEVAIYREVARLMDHYRELFLPPITLQFTSWKKQEIIKEAQSLSLEEVVYNRDPHQYPPVVKARVKKSWLRVLIEFGDYYTENDLDTVAMEARKENYSALLFHFPNVDNGNIGFFTSKHLIDCVIYGKVQSSWLWSALEEDRRKKYLDQACEPQKIKGKKDMYDCPIHKGKYINVGFAAHREWDCRQCRYNLGEGSQCLCIGHTGIQSLEDFGLSPGERQAKVEKIKAENEKRIEEKERQKALEAERKEKGRERTRTRTIGMALYRPLKTKPAAPSQKELDAERDRIMANFNPESKEITMDCFNRRWILCERCGKIKESKDMPDYGGPQRGPNRGICRDCNDK